MFARTDRLLLRPGWIEDAPALVRGLTDSAVSRNMARVPFPYTIADAEAWLSRACAESLPSLLVFARTQRAPRLVGGVGLHRDGDGAVELGYWIGRPFWGLGFATEAAGAMVRLAHHSLGLRRIVAGHFRDNPASANVLRKLGFRSTGVTVARHSLARGGEVPCLLFARDADADVSQPSDRALAA